MNEKAIAEISKNFHAEHRGNCAMSVAYGYDAESLEDFFRRGAKNCTKCKEIRPNAVIPCNRCVELAGEALDFLNK